MANIEICPCDEVSLIPIILVSNIIPLSSESSRILPPNSILTTIVVSSVDLENEVSRWNINETQEVHAQDDELLNFTPTYIIQSKSEESHMLLKNLV